MRHEFCHIYSSDLDVPVRIKIVSLFGCLPLHTSGWMRRLAPKSGCIFLRLKLYCNGRQVCEPIQTSSQHFFSSNSLVAGVSSSTVDTGSNSKEIQRWNEWIDLQVTYAELSRDAYLHISVWDISEYDIEPLLIAECTKSLFSKHGIFRSGLTDLCLYTPTKASTSREASISSERGKIFGCFRRDSASNNDLLNQDKKKFDSHRTSGSPPSSIQLASKRIPPGGVPMKELLKHEKLYKQNFIEHLDWLDRITFSRIEEIKQNAKTEDRSLYLIVEFPKIFDLVDSTEYSILFFVEDEDQRTDDPLVVPSSRDRHNNQIFKRVGGTTYPVQPVDYAILTTGGLSSELEVAELIYPEEATNFVGIDPELGLDNLCEIKHNMLTRNARSNDIDRLLQPNPSARDALETIIRAPSCQPISVEDRDLIWKFRFWLKSNPKALTKFVRSVNWQEKQEVRQAIQVILEWEPIDACDAIELLTPVFSHAFVRRYAVSRLQQTSYANILLYLPQLVQALRYEPWLIPAVQSLQISENEKDGENVPNSLAVPSPSSAGRERSNPSHSDDEFINVLSDQSTTAATNNHVDFPLIGTDMASFLLRAACENSMIANFLFWYLKVEVEANANLSNNHPLSHMYSEMIARLKKALSSGGSSERHTLSTIASQKKFVDNLVNMAKFTAEVGGNRTRKLEALKKKLSECSDLNDLKGLSLPLDPSVHVKSVQIDSTILFSSNLMPMRLTFSTVRGSVSPYECGEAYTTIFKRGDDLRQDQLVLQMIRLMDNLLKDDKLDLCITPYSVLATSCTEGFVQFVKATPLADLKSIQDTLRLFRPSSSGQFGIEADALNNYVKSCAGYSIICYILGVGDRHLHNLLLCENGRMFHVDFGFILDRDPKPMPPPMKLTSEMINAMGGQNSEHFKNFVKYCATAFCILRRHANLIINLFSLMLDSGIPDIAIEKDKAVMKILDKFHLNISDEEACQKIVSLIESSISAKMPVIVDFVHNVKQLISN